MFVITHSSKCVIAFSNKLRRKTKVTYHLASNLLPHYLVKFSFNKKYILWDMGIGPIAEIPHDKFHCNRTIHCELRPKMIFKMAAILHLELLEFGVYVMQHLSPCYSAGQHKISLKWPNWLLSYGQKTVLNMAAVRHLEI